MILSGCTHTSGACVPGWNPVLTTIASAALTKYSQECVPRVLKDLGMFLLSGLYPHGGLGRPFPLQQNFGGGSFLCWLTHLLEKICCQEGSGSSEFPNSVLLTFWTTCKNKARLIKPGIFKLWFILCVFVGGQERKLLSCVSIARLQQGNVSFGAWILGFFWNLLMYFFCMAPSAAEEDLR